MPHHLDTAYANSANQRFHYDAKTGHLTGFDGRCLDVEGGSKAEGAKLIYYDKGAGAAPNQTWDYKDGYFITRMGTGFCIDVSGGAGNVKDGGQLILWKPANGNNQKWDIDSAGYIRSRHNHNFCIDVNGGAKPAKGLTAVSVWTCAIPGAHAHVIGKLQTCANQRFHYDAASGHITGFDGRCLDIEGGSKAEGAKVIYYDKGAGSAPNQTWDYKDGYFISRNGTGFCIDVSGGAGNVKDGGQLIVWKPANGANQKWDIDAYGFIRSRANHKFCIDVNGGAKPAKGATPISLWTAAV
jgi:hypothetical protein